MNKTIIILNGPPGSGKDTIAEAIAEKYLFTTAEFKERLHKIAIALSGLDAEEYYSLYNDRSLKETKTDLLLGFSPRGFLIHISEAMCKPCFGRDYFGIMAARNIKSNVVFSDGGFPSEVNVLVDQFGKDSIHIIHLYREGCTFDGDSRKYILERDTGIHPIVVGNDTTVNDAVLTIMGAVVDKSQDLDLLKTRVAPL